MAFPRFYFVAPADLLDILSKGSNPQAILRCALPCLLASKRQAEKVQRTRLPVAGSAATLLSLIAGGKQAAPVDRPSGPPGAVAVMHPSKPEQPWVDFVSGR